MMQEEKFVEIAEIWKTRDGNENIKIAEKLLAVLANGYPIFVAKDYAIELHKKTKQEADEIRNRIKSY